MSEPVETGSPGERAVADRGSQPPCEPIGAARPAAS
jgi:hypothetical protein